MLKKFAKFLLSFVWGRKWLQKPFFFLNWFSLKGMNYGGGSTFSESGELNAFEVSIKGLNTKSAVIVFDVGANVGKYALATSQILENLAKKFELYSFEPSKATFAELEKNTQSIKNIRRQNLALHNKNELLTLFSNESLSGLASMYERDLEFLDINMSLKEQIEAVRLDDFCKKNAIGRIHFLKLDVEGNELKVLEGAKEFIESGKIENIQFEFGGANIDSRTYFKDFFYLLEDKYKIYRILPSGLYHIPKYSENLEIFFTVNYLATLK